MDTGFLNRCGVVFRGDLAVPLEQKLNARMAVQTARPTFTRIVPGVGDRKMQTFDDASSQGLTTGAVLHPLLPMAYPFTVIVHVRRDDTSGWHAIIASGTWGNNGWNLLFQSGVGYLLMANAAASSTAVSTSGAAVVPTATHVTAAYVGRSAADHKWWCYDLEARAWVFEDYADTSSETLTPSTRGIDVGCARNSIGGAWDFFQGGIGVIYALPEAVPDNELRQVMMRPYAPLVDDVRRLATDFAALASQPAAFFPDTDWIAAGAP